MAKKMTKIASLALSLIMGASMLTGSVNAAVLTKTKVLDPEQDAMVFATEALTGNFNPFYTTASADANIVEQTQISMLTMDKNGQLTAGDEYATAVKDFTYQIIGMGDEQETVYTFVMKNGIQFSDGKPLTMNDVFFNMYEYLDPVYTGSSSMNAIDIEGLADYRLQQVLSDGNDMSEQIAAQASMNAWLRIDELVTLRIPNISGIVSLGHTTGVSTVSVNGREYAVAQEYNADGTTKNSDEYAVLQITVNGTDPKAIYDLNFMVAPAHYYGSSDGTGTDVVIDIKNNKFGVEYGSSDFQSKVIQSQQHVEVPVGAGAYKAIEGETSVIPTGEEFYHNDIVYFQRNEHFHTVGNGLTNAKIKYMQYKEISSDRVLDALSSGEIHFGEPNYTQETADRIAGLDMVSTATSWENGYGYIGINAGKIPNVNIRRAIMSAMQTSLALEYYPEGACSTIDWPMSRVSWAYPFADDGATSKPNNSPYTHWTGVESAKEKIQYYMSEAGVQAGDSALKIKLTIAGASITDHPTYTVFKQAAEILNSMGWDVEVKADSQALTKLATGSLEVWAAARGSIVDPDMYQVYHKNSSVSSVLAWGYREIRDNPSKYEYEKYIIDELSEIIDEARSVLDTEVRKVLYEEAMGLVLDLAIEMPVYQRKNLTVWNHNIIDSNTLNLEYSFISDLTDRPWEIDFTEGVILPPEDSSEDSTADSDSSSEFVENSSEDSSEDGQYPKFRWNQELNLWEVSYDGGKTWIMLEEKKDSSSSSVSSGGGCGSMIVGGEISVLLLLGGALLMVKQKRES